MTPSVSTFRFRRAADFTALRLGRAALGYLALITAVITLAPFRFAPAPSHGWTTMWTWSDLVMNVVMFVPIGFMQQLTRPRGAAADWRQVLLLGALLSGAIECAQLFEPERFSSGYDVATNTAGALLGAWLVAVVRQRHDGDVAVQTLALESPLMGLVYLLVPLAWLLQLGSEGDGRTVLLPLLATIAGAVMGTVHAATVRGEGVRRGASARWLVALPVGWVLVAGAPTASRAWTLLASSAGAAVVAAWASDGHSRRVMAGGRRRVEQATLRLVLPLFASYLALTTLWSPRGDVGPWRWTLALTLPEASLSQAIVFRALEHIAAFTLVGYLSAERQGRREARLARLLLDVAPVVGLTAVVLEGARGFRPGVGSSLLMLLFSLTAAVFGGYVYTLQRAHVRALVRRRERLAAFVPVSTQATVRRRAA